MSARAVVKMGNAKLSLPSKEVDIIDCENISTIINDMWDTMNKEGGVGLAAPQIGVNLCIIVFGFEQSTRYPNEPAVPLTALINPSIQPLSDELEDGWEACLSIPGLCGLVPRWKYIRYSGKDINGQEIYREVEGFHARIVQHECDHLNGILYPARIKDFKYFGFNEEIKSLR